jgi:hypothetical protein
MKAIANYDIETKVLGLSADNTGTNFGDLLRRGKENVSTTMKSQLNRNLIGIGCNADIIQNCSRTAFDSMPVDIEVLAGFEVLTSVVMKSTIFWDITPLPPAFTLVSSSFYFFDPEDLGGMFLRNVG